MGKEFINYEEALALKDLGFDVPCYAWYVSKTYGLEFGLVHVEELIKDAILAPTYSQAFRWFRNKHKLSGEPQSHQFWFSYNIIYDTLGENICKSVSYGYESYEEAELICLRKLIEIIKKRNDE